MHADVGQVTAELQQVRGVSRGDELLADGQQVGRIEYICKTSKEYHHVTINLEFPITSSSLFLFHSKLFQVFELLFATFGGLALRYNNIDYKLNDY